MVVDKIVKDIKRKRELAGLGEDIVLREVGKLLRANAKLARKVEGANTFDQLRRSGEYKELLKQVRARLREIYGVFNLDEKRERGELLLNLKRSPGDDRLTRKLLSLHQSTKERLPYYASLYRAIFGITGNPKSILDLGCGANPYSHGSLGYNPSYTAVDLPGEDLRDIEVFFKCQKIKGKVLGLDLVHEHERLRNLPHHDVAFCFKLLDSLETSKRHVSSKLLDAINATWIVVSFPTMSLGGKKAIKKERRAWFERLLGRFEWWYEQLTVGDESLYVVLKDPGELARQYYEAHAKALVQFYKSYDNVASMERFCHFMKGNKIIDLGSGIGRDAAWFAGKGFEVSAIDQNELFLRQVAKHSKRIKTIKADMRKLPFKNSSYDGIWAMAVLVHIYPSEVVQVLRECHRVLHTGGRLFVKVKQGVSGIQTRFGNPVYYQKFTRLQIESLLQQALFEIDECKVVDQRAFSGSSEKVIVIFARAT